MAEAKNLTPSLLDAPQIIKRTFDNGKDATRTTTVSGTLVTEQFDSVGVDYPSDSVEVYTYYQGGLAGAVVATVTVTYTDNTKTSLDSVVRI